MRNVSVSTQRQAASALPFLYHEVLALPLEPPPGVVRPPRRRRLPIVLTRAEVGSVLSHLSGTSRLVASLLYGGGLRLMEALQLRIKDLSVERREIVVRTGKGGHDRITILPTMLVPDVKRQIAHVRTRHTADVQRGAGWVALPQALERKFTNAAHELAWQYLFPAARHYTDSATGQRRRHHLHETAVQQEVSMAVREAGIAKRATCHTFRHSFATICSRTGTTSARFRSCSAIAV